MVTKQFIAQKMLDLFPYAPTGDQEQLIHELALFLLDMNPATMFLLKGYAGTGKTTIISTLVAVVAGIGNQPVLLAPTGRAAKVLSSFANETAFTIHKKIYRLQAAADGSMHLSIQPNKHKRTLFIVDEASLISSANQLKQESYFGDSNLLDDLVQYVYGGQHCRLILIGDSAQLPPVHMEESRALQAGFMGSKYHLTLYSFELKDVVRQAKESGILFNATLLRELITKGTPAFPLFNMHGFGDFFRLGHDEVTDEIHNAFHPQNLTESIIICRSNKRAYLYNRHIRERILFMEEEISSGDLLMVVKNNYFWLSKDSQAGFIANGDILEVKRITKIEEIYGFRFADVHLTMIDYKEEPALEAKLVLNTLDIEGPSLDMTRYKQLYAAIEEDYIHIENRTTRRTKIMENPYMQALQVKYAYAMTCHKAQGGQWENVFVDMGYIPENIPDVAYNRWLYTAVTRATRKLFLLNFTDDYFL
jgi:exodeoxyribonuclease V